MLKILKHKKEKTMENYYEVKGVSQATEIRKAYEEAVKSNAPKYRAVSKTNLIYGWDEKANKFIKAEIGQEWFDNPHYVAPIETVEEPIEEAVEPIVEEMVEVANEMVEEVKAEETVEEKEPEVDYKALYEEKCKETDGLKEDLETAKKYAEHYKAENEELKDGLLAFKTLLNKF